MRTLNYAGAIREGHAQLLKTDPRVFVLGQGLWSPWYAGSTLKELDVDFGVDRVIDSPVSENATTGAAVGAAIAGMRPIVFHPRMDFMLLAVDPIVNQASNWSYVFNGAASVPLVIRSVINRRGEQGAQHSQALQAMYAHIPGLKVVMPATPADAKGLLISASQDGNPIVYIDDRMLYAEEGHVPEEMYSTPIGKAAIRREGGDITIVATSRMVMEAVKAAEILAEQDVEAEIVDLRTIKPFDQETILESVAKTGRLVIVDEAWKTGSIAGDISATVCEQGFDLLQAPIARVCLPNCPAPASQALEQAYYLSESDIIAAVQRTVGLKRSNRKAA
ncbi:MAG: transketolase C-terminal domain-containing protein [Candidatus Paceibacterota bacterium]